MKLNGQFVGELWFVPGMIDPPPLDEAHIVRVALSLRDQRPPFLPAHAVVCTVTIAERIEPEIEDEP